MMTKYTQQHGSRVRTRSLKTGLLFLVCSKQWVTDTCNHDGDYVHLSDTIHRLKAFNAKRKWRAVAAVVMLGARLGLKKRNRSASEEEREERGCESKCSSRGSSFAM